MKSFSNNEYYEFQFKILKLEIINAQNQDKLTYQDLYPPSTQQPVFNEITNQRLENVSMLPLPEVEICSSQVQASSSQNQTFFNLEPSLNAAHNNQVRRVVEDRAASLPPIRENRQWPTNFEYPSHRLSSLTLKALSDPAIKLRQNEIKEVVQVLFTVMIDITGLYPSSCQYLLVVDSIVRRYRQLEEIDGKNGRVSKIFLFYFIVFQYKLILILIF